MNHDPFVGGSLDVFKALGPEVQRKVAGTPLSLWPSVVVHVQADRADLVRREELARDLRDAGVHDLARKIETMEVPRGRLLYFVDLEETLVLVGEPTAVLKYAAEKLDEPLPPVALCTCG